MKTRKSAALTAILLFLAGAAVAISSRTTSTVKDGRRITTKVTTDNKGVTTTVITTKGPDGAATTTTTVTDKDGKILSTDDPNAKTQADAAAKDKAQKQAELASAPKRGPNDPIQVALIQTVESEDLKKATTKDGVFPYVRKEFEQDPVIKLLDQGRVDKYVASHDYKTGQSTQFSSFNNGPEFLPADVYVETFATMEQEVGVNKATHKLASAPFLKYRATITTDYGAGPWDVTEEGYILANQEVTKKFADKIRGVILNQAGPTIPKEAARFRRGTAGMTQEQADAGEALRNLFKKKK